MNLHFTIAMHALAYLAKHHDSSFSSSQLAELICVNPVQLRTVMTQLVHNDLVIASPGKFGGYKSIENAQEIQLSLIFNLFRIKTPDTRVITGEPTSTCAIARNMKSIIEDFQTEELTLLSDFYSHKTIGDILTIVNSKENSHD
ncbi:Rrf2 family transcriptional regulator [Alloscardovia theropitheci]|nr:Rrf2 family transcriptional regulator [Alloscardovia theropitheci]